MRAFGKRGFTLIELMVAVSLFGIGIMALLQVYSASVTTSRRAEMAYTAYNLAKDHVERLRAVSFASLTSAASETTGVRLDRYGSPQDDGDYMRTTTVATSYTGDASLTSISVSVWYYFRGVQSPTSMDVSTVIYSGA